MDSSSWFCNTTSRKPACFSFRGGMMIKASLLIPSYQFPILEDRQLTPFIAFKCINTRRAHAAASWHSSNSGVVLKSYCTPSKTAKRHTPSPRAWHSCFLFSSVLTSRLTPELAGSPLPYSSLFTSPRSAPRTAPRYSSTAFPEQSPTSFQPAALGQLHTPCHLLTLEADALRTPLERGGRV